jgi:carbamoyltransferase
MNILGINAYHHDSSAAAISGAKIIGASHEERFTRKKFDNSFPHNTISWLRDTYNDYDFVVFSDKKNYSRFKSDIKKYSNASPVLVDHHEAHAMSSILMKDWSSCAVMVVDTVGDTYSTSLGYYDGITIRWLKRFKYPNSLGLFYSAATRLLGFEPLADESKVMAAASYGSPKWQALIESKILNITNDGYQVLTDLERGVGYGVLDWDIASSVQTVLEKSLISLATWLHKETGSLRLAYAGGVALNCVANTKILLNTDFEEIAIQPAAGDAGCALGAAAIISRPLWENAYLGVSATNNTTSDDCAKRLLNNEIVPIIHGRAEFGPRALGNRSFLAIPTQENIKKLNIIKNRLKTSWQPYAAVCLEKEANDFFDIAQKSYDMLFTANATKSNFTTTDNTVRLQVTNLTKNSYLHRILDITRQYGYPILINTSLNAQGKPIVNTKEDYEKEL